jgi:hypothetical protein
MSAHKDRNAGASRDQTRARLRTLTNAALLATTGATVGIAVVVAHEHPGKSAASTSTSGKSTVANTGSSGGSGADGNSGTSSTANTGNSGSSLSPSTSSQSPSVTSGGSSRR